MFAARVCPPYPSDAASASITHDTEKTLFRAIKQNNFLTAFQR